MQFPMLSASEMDVARVHRRNPHDLHWRKDPPAWPGRVDSAYRRLYPHLVDEFCCMQCGAIPCPFDHAEDRDTRMQDMTFVGDIVKEKKEMEEEIAKLREKIAFFQQSQQKWISEKQTLQRHVYELETAKQSHEKEKTSLAQDMNRLRATNNRLQQDIHSQKKELDRMTVLEQQLSKLKEELKDLEEKSKLNQTQVHPDGHSSNEGQPTELEKLLQSQLDQLMANFETLLSTRVEEAERARKMAEEEAQEKARQLEELRKRLKDSEEMEFKSLNAVVDQNNELDRIRDELEALGHVKDALEKQVRENLDEIRRLRERLEDDRGFRRYVGVLRQLNEVKDANDTLRWKLEEKPGVTLMALNPGEIQNRRSRPLAVSAGVLDRGKTGRRSKSTAISVAEIVDKEHLGKTT